MPTARRLVRDCLAAACHPGPESLIEDAALIASEFVTNALEHGHPPIDLLVGCDDSTVRIEVTSGTGPTSPAAADPDPGTPDGRGLTIVGMLAADWGWRREGGRIRVWAELTR